MSFISKIAAATVAIVASATSALAVGLTPSNQGGQIVFTVLDNGNTAGLFTITGASVGDTLTLAGVQALQVSGPSVLNILAGDPGALPPAGFQSGALVGSPAILSNVNGGVEIAALSSGSGSVFDALFLEFDATPMDFLIGGATAVFKGTSTFAIGKNSVELDITPPAPIPVPAALPLLATALGGLAWMRRRRG